MCGVDVCFVVWMCGLWFVWCGVDLWICVVWMCGLCCVDVWFVVWFVWCGVVWMYGVVCVGCVVWFVWVMVGTFIGKEPFILNETNFNQHYLKNYVILDKTV